MFEFARAIPEEAGISSLSIMRVLDELDKKSVPLIFSAVFGAVQPAELVEWIIASKRNYLRFQLQMHKFVWPPEMRGV